ncbi:4a-hydroxytetrahydrobiopterin dehydratase [Halobacillus locisalis]|uniref:Putative pterin-4-alpha-carbinolamine dehydratase n=1 Tax=Halobacillus locisalis TaxID=220753 RepID=A0A838CY04_9BACI|nr:4a-hydroxytetrahydrobiopterin dehydratase [Halobacillus locisalis]MBA2176476.1 4a-hydroxytetrahydrobiopterin dehydratase [Halobacillus locisalis]
MADQTRISGEEKEQRVSQLDGWKLVDEKFVTKRFRFQDFLTGIQFVNRVAEYAEDIQHHPFISIDYKMVTIKLTSWEAGGLTELDLECARRYDDLYATLAE